MSQQLCPNGKTRFLPKETFPRWESRGLEERVLKDSLDASKSLDDICSVGVEIPELSIVTLTGPPEWITLH